MNIEQARANALIAHASRVSFVAPDQSHPHDGLIVREYANATHYLISILGQANDRGRRSLRHDFGKLVVLGKGRAAPISEGFLHAWWNPDVPDVAGLSGLESCTLHGRPASLARWVAHYMRYVGMNMSRWHGPLAHLDRMSLLCPA
jgi:hypothetical protein